MCLLLPLDVHPSPHISDQSHSALASATAHHISLLPPSHIHYSSHKWTLLGLPYSSQEYYTAPRSMEYMTER